MTKYQPLLLPPGYRFRPSEEDLAKYYLHNRVFGDGKPFNGSCFVKECDLYGTKAEPWEIWNLFRGDELDGEEGLYFFTHLKKKEKKKTVSEKHMERSMGTGTWRVNNAAAPVHDRTNQKKPIGLKKTFKYKNAHESSIPEMNGCSWILHEFSLIDSPPINSDIVLCLLKKKVDKNDKNNIRTPEDQLSCLPAKKQKLSVASCSFSSVGDATTIGQLGVSQSYCGNFLMTSTKIQEFNGADMAEEILAILDESGKVNDVSTIEEERAGISSIDNVTGQLGLSQSDCGTSIQELTGDDVAEEILSVLDESRKVTDDGTLPNEEPVAGLSSSDITIGQLGISQSGCGNSNLVAATNIQELSGDDVGEEIMALLEEPKKVTGVTLPDAADGEHARKISL